MRDKPEEDAEPRQQYVNEDGVCWAQQCARQSTHLLVTRGKPDAAFPQGLLVAAAYCWEDGVWFAGSAVVRGDTFVSLEASVTPPVDGGNGA